MTKKLLLSITLASLLASSSLLSQENLDADLGGFDTEEVVSQESGDLDGFGDEEENSDLDGFGDDEIAAVEEIASEAEDKEVMFSLSGDLAFKTSYGYHSHRVDAQQGSNAIDYSGFNQAQTSLYLQVDGKLSDNWKVRISGDAYYDAIYNLHPNNNYNDDTLDTYKTQLMLTDTYIQGRLTNEIDLKVGRQIVVWGKSDSIRITDVINPLDNRLPGLTDIEDLRLSVGMAKVDYYIGQWNFSAMAIGESRIMLEAAPRGEFFPVDNVFPLGAPDPFIELETPDSSWDNMQYALAANGVFSGWDLSFYAADVLDQKWHIENVGTPNAKRVVTKVKMLGSAINIATGSWLLKSEVAYLDGVKYNSTTDDKARLDTLIGFDYMGIKDTVLSLELANRHIFDYETQMSSLVGTPDYVDKNEIQTAMRATRSFENDSINATALVSMFGASWEYGGFARVWVEYDVMDAVVANFGVVDYIDGDKPFIKAISDNDRVFADITYSF
ncbi:MAG: DUF1302 family protein [Campylobacterota bacterium]|nr:DUF1302 family protein [Campylobacterota bacterium]